MGVFRNVVLLLSLILISTLCGCHNTSKNPKPPFQSPAGNVLFEDVAAESGIGFVIKQTTSPINIQQNVGHGVGLIDVDGDGLLDIVLVGPNQVKLYKNLGNYHFQDITAQSGLAQPGFWEGIAVGDYDNDGKPDLYLCGYNCSALYHNEGGGKFKDVTRRMGLSSLPVGKDTSGDWRTSAGFVDLSGDGKLDLYVCRYALFGPGFAQICHDPKLAESMACAPNAYTPQKGILYRNRGDHFQDITRESGMSAAAGRSLGLAFGDYDNDGKIDIALANDEIQGNLFKNESNFHFVDHGLDSNTALSEAANVHGGMGIDWADYDGDGKLDLFVATFQDEEKNLYHNLGSGLFQDVSQEVGLAPLLTHWVSFGAKFFDYDNDGWPDLIVTSGHVIDNTGDIYPGTQYRQPTMLFHNNGKRFEDISSQLGPLAAKLMVGRGLAVGDLTNSGRLDVLISDLDGPTRLLQNRVRNANHWITLRLQGVQNCRDGFGARVTIMAGGRTQFLDVTNAGSFLAANDPRVHFGLGSATMVDKITVHWPNGHTDVFTQVPADGFYHLVEGASQPQKGW